MCVKVLKCTHKSLNVRCFESFTASTRSIPSIPSNSLFLWSYSFFTHFFPFFFYSLQHPLMGTIKNRDEWMRIYDWFPPTVALNNCIVSCVFLFIYIHAFHVIMETHLRGTLKSLRHHGTMIPRDLKGVLIWPPIITRGFSYSGFYLFFFSVRPTNC